MWYYLIHHCGNIKKTLRNSVSKIKLAALAILNLLPICVVIWHLRINWEFCRCKVNEAKHLIPTDLYVLCYFIMQYVSIYFYVPTCNTFVIYNGRSFFQKTDRASHGFCCYLFFLLYWVKRSKNQWRSVHINTETPMISGHRYAFATVNSVLKIPTTHVGETSVSMICPVIRCFLVVHRRNEKIVVLASNMKKPDFFWDYIKFNAYYFTNYIWKCEKSNTGCFRLGWSKRRLREMLKNGFRRVLELFLIQAVELLDKA